MASVRLTSKFVESVRPTPGKQVAYQSARGAPVIPLLLVMEKQPVD